MATIPLSGTDIRLLSGVPFSKDYKHTRWHNNANEQYSYFNSLPKTSATDNSSFQRIEGRMYYNCKKNVDSLWGTKYMMFQNKDYNMKWFYAFVTKLEYISNGLTRVHFEIDVLQTWMFEMEFKPSFVVREHRPLWDENGAPILNTIDEGLNYGTEYQTISVEKYEAFEQLSFMVIVCKNPMHGTVKKEITPIINGMPQPMTFYIHPFYYQNGKTPTVDGRQVLSPLKDTLAGLYATEKAQDNIVSIYITDHIGILFDWDGQDLKPPSDTFDVATMQTDGKPQVSTLYLKNLSKYNPKIIEAGGRYEHFTKSRESKLLMHPYTTITLTDFKGNRVDYKPQYLKPGGLELLVKGSAGLGNKVSWGLIGYNTFIDGEDGHLLVDEHSVIVNTPNDVPIMTDHLAAYLQGNRNSLEAQKDSIYFNSSMNMIQGGMYGVGSAMNRNPVGAGLGATQVAQGYGEGLLQIQQMEAKQKDLANLPPNITKQGSNSYYDYGNGHNGFYVIKKEIKEEYRKKLEDFFNMFGYKTHETKLPNIHTRKSWNFIQTNSCNINGDFNTEDLEDIKRIFDNGITLWHTNDVGNYYLGNEVL